MRGFLLLMIIQCWVLGAYAQKKYNGRILDDKLEPLPGASVRIIGTKTGTLTDANGAFELVLSPKDTLLVSSLGYTTRQVTGPFQTMFNVILVSEEGSLKEVVVATGYQTLKKEGATGAFSHVGNELLNRSVSTNFIDRLRDVVPGLSFNRSGASTLSIRGQSTIYGNAEPLIVLDDFPFEGDLGDINPNDIEGITVLRDAAAASIWGARAGNGVIVVTTKKGLANQKVNISFNGNVTVGAVPDLYASSRLNSVSYIEIEQKLFAQGFYNAAQSTGFQPLTPVVELLFQKRANPAMTQIIDSEIERLKTLDVRQDFAKYLYRPAVQQQYAVNVRGGGNSNSYYLSLGYDHNRDNLVGDGMERISLVANNDFKWFQNKLSLSTGINLALNTNFDNALGTTLSNATAGGSIYPYAELADEFGNHLPVVANYRNSFVERAQGQGLLDWSYVPLNEANLLDFQTKRRLVRANTALTYALLPWIRLSLRYQYTNSNAVSRNHRDAASYFSRDLINRFTQVQASGLVRPIPLGGILDRSDQNLDDHGLRTQLDMNKRMGKFHDISAIFGYEVRGSTTSSHNNRFYGYDHGHAQTAYVDYVTTTFPFFYDVTRRGRIPFVDAIGLYNDRFRSFYSNMTYTYADRYILSGSARLDQSNLFGVETNQKGIPLWSAGLAWRLDKEDFYNWAALPNLKLRMSYGYSGNVDKTVSAYTTAAFAGYNFQLPFANIINPPNPALRWERVRTVNMALDFGIEENRVSGSVEYYQKKGMDLIGNMPLPPSAGIILFRGNYASTIGKGWELSLNTQNLIGKLQWKTDWLLSLHKEKVIGYDVNASVTQYLQAGVNLPLKGRSPYTIYSYSWAGLDPVNGDPMGYLNGEPSKDFAAIIRAASPTNLNSKGTSRPTAFGALRNTLNFGPLGLSFQVVYRLGYVFRKNSVNYGANLGLASGHSDYTRRWQLPGDEQRTFVPSAPTAVNVNRDSFYRYADVLVDRADNIRLQDMRIDYTLDKSPWLPFQQMQLFVYGSNLGMLWKATKFDVDPDLQAANFPTTVAFGLKVNLK